ncbi:hypothetical protein CYY_004675 [Polysphondylium violaceum]|uniref:Uncharacterized protein n=1 Tax=Polysphondylium violaceum TaxID=133409 RepID=A0A8J4V7J9_9MYCE|nr:hypothetical protein CYY_004675 [Polysphondylium violaceum]
MKAITTFLLLLGLCALGFVNAYPIKGYGNLTPYNIYTFNQQNNQKYAQALIPQPKQVIAISGSSSDVPQSFDIVYSNSKDSITWGSVNYANGKVSDKHVFGVPKTVTLNNVICAQVVVKPDNNTLYYMTTENKYGDDIIYWVASRVESQDDLNHGTTVWPMGYGDNAQGAFDYTTETDYYIVMINKYAQNSYKAFWLDPYTNSTVKVTNLNAPTSPIFKIFAYKETLYLVQPSRSNYDIIEISSVDWSGQTLNKVSSIKVSTQPNQLDIHVYGDYIAIISRGLNQPQAEVVLVELHKFTVLDFLQGLSSGQGSNYFIF